MAELSKSEKYDMLVKHVTDIERQTGSATFYIVVDLLLKSFIDDVALENKKIAPEIKNIPCFKDSEVNNKNFTFRAEKGVYQELLEIIAVKENEAIQKINGKSTESLVSIGKLLAYQDLFELLMYKNLASKGETNEKC